EPASATGLSSPSACPGRRARSASCRSNPRPGAASPADACSLSLRFRPFSASRSRLLRRAAALLAMTGNSVIASKAKQSRRERLRVVGVVVGVAQNAAGQRPGVLALLIEHLAIDDRGEDAFGRLLDPPGTLWEVADDGLVPALHGGRIE